MGYTLQIAEPVPPFLVAPSGCDYDLLLSIVPGDVVTGINS